MKTCTHLIIADDHALFRDGLKSLIDRRRDMEVVAEVETASALMQTIGDNPCDVLLLDLQIERSTLNDIGPLAARTNVLVVTASESVEDALAALHLGARSIVQKRFPVQTLNGSSSC
jgi:two-component system, NarL family, response regulator